jgi:BirA family biotin operon repressor/biotin-[acetyl-CoA-carboxylase] ligase
MFQNPLQASMSWKFVYLPTIGSTNSFVKDNLANTGPLHLTAVFTDHQTEGRGQYDRKWSSTAGQNLLCSLLIPMEHSEVPHQDLYQWNMYIAAVIRQVLDSLVEPNVYIKWPNDIIINDKKVGGILIENIYSGSKLSASIIGIGINVNQIKFDKSLPNATSLQVIDGKHRDPTEILYALTSTFDQESLMSKSQENPDLVLNLYNRYLYNLGNEVTCIDTENNAIKGVLKGVSVDGHLQLQVDQASLSLSHSQYKLML